MRRLTNRINHNVKFYYHTNQDKQFGEPMKIDNTKPDNKLFTKSNYLTATRDSLGGTFYCRAMKTGLDRIAWVTNLI